MWSSTLKFLHNDKVHKKKKNNYKNTKTQKTIYIHIQNDSICFPDLFYTLLCHMNSQTIICKCVVVLIECKEISLKFCDWISIVVSEKVPVDTKLRCFLSSQFACRIAFWFAVQFRDFFFLNIKQFQVDINL